jgi:hypothetical protein
MEHVGNLWNILGTHWELEGNMLGQRKNETNPPTPHPPPPPQLNRKKSRNFEFMLSLPIGCMKFLGSKTGGHHFWPGLIPPLKTGGTSSLRITIMALLPAFIRK